MSSFTSSTRFRLSKSKTFVFSVLTRWWPNYNRSLLPVFLCVLLIHQPTREITLAVLSDAFWQVAVFVALTLAVYHSFARRINRLYIDSKGQRLPLFEVSTASFMGALPGCGGAIIVITQYVSGHMSFGSVVAVLTATMGDAAFLLIASEPTTGMSMMALGIVVGIVSGVTVNNLHGTDFLRSSAKQPSKSLQSGKSNFQQPLRLRAQGILWKWLMVPTALVGLLMAAQIDVASFIGVEESVVQLIGALTALGFIFLWAVTREVTNFESIVAEDRKSRQTKVFQKVALDTNFVTSWVVVAFLGFELVMFYGNFSMEALFTQLGAIMPLMGVLVGMIPGCGPQIITTSLYLSGVIPLSAQIGNAISNDGDALFPAIALSPRVALVATFYSAIPALLMAYGYFWLFE